MTLARSDDSSTSEMPEWQKLALKAAEEKNPPPASRKGGKAGDSDRGNTRAQTFTQDELYADSIPDVNLGGDLPEPYVASDTEVERIIDSTPIETQYAKFGKGDTPEPRGAERIIRCPLPTHRDTHPSASYNVESGLFNCMGCGASGDIFRVAAAHYGMNDDSSDLPYIKRKLASDLSGSPVEQYGNHEVLATPAVRAAMEVEQRRASMYLVGEVEKLDAELAEEQRHEPEPAPALDPATEIQPEQTPRVPPAGDSPSAPDQPSTTETENYDWVSRPIPMGDNAPEMREFNSGMLDCEAVVKDGTFLGEYYKDAIRDRVPHEFHLWNGILALSLAVGRTIEFVDAEGTSYPNFYICFVAKSAAGKSRSKAKFKGVIELAMPYDEASPKRNGVKILQPLSSGEALEKEMQAPLVTLDMTGVVSNGNVKAYWYEDEFKSFYVKSVKRDASRLKEALTQAFSGDSLGSTALSRGTFHAPEPFLCFDTGVQPGILREVMSKDDADSGFLNRFLFVGAAHRLTAKEEYDFDQQVEDFDFPAHAMRLREINKWCHDGAGKQLAPLRLKMEPDVARAFSHMMRTEFRDITHGAHAENMLARMDLHFRRLCVAMCANEMTDTMTMDIFKRTLHLYWYVKRTSLLIAGKVEDSQSNEDDNYIVSIVRELYLKQVEDGMPPEKRGVTTGDMWRKRARRVIGRRGITLDQFKRQVETLADAGLLKDIEPADAKKINRGRPSGTRYIPTVDKD